MLALCGVRNLLAHILGFALCGCSMPFLHSKRVGARLLPGGITDSPSPNI
jgi:hypothetical protein